MLDCLGGVPLDQVFLPHHPQRREECRQHRFCDTSTGSWLMINMVRVGKQSTIEIVSVQYVLERMEILCFSLQLFREQMEISVISCQMRRFFTILISPSVRFLAAFADICRLPSSPSTPVGCPAGLLPCISPVLR